MWRHCRPVRGAPWLAIFLACAAEAHPQPSLSPRNANYVIEVKLLPEARMIEGREILSWRNDQEQPTSELWFHLYWNGWRNNRSSWLLEDAVRRREEPRKIREEDWSYCEVDSVRFLAGVGYEGADLSAARRFASPDDGNPDDRTVMVVTLPRPVERGETVQVEISWRSKIPRTFSRTGFRGNYFFFAHWFPKLAVYENEGWNCHQFHAATEFFSDYGVYDVSMSVPEQYVLGATGRQVNRKENPDGTVTYRHVQEDVHDFAWTVSPDYLVQEARFEEPGLPPVDMRLLIQPEHLAQADRHFEATRVALRNYGKWYGPYPYGHVSIVDPAYGSGAGGMEYPTFFTAGTRLFNPFGGGSPEGVTVHECGHQFWYGLIGNNEFEHAWLDEGLNTFSTARAMEEAYGETVLVRRYLGLPGMRPERAFLPVRFKDLTLPRLTHGNRLDGYREVASADPQSTPTYLYFPASASAITYDKTALWLATLERYLGWETLQKILSTFFERWKFKHPRPEDFFAIANEESGQDLTWFFDQVHRSSEVFDYAIESVSSQPADPEGFLGGEGKLTYTRPEKKDQPKRYRTEVVVRRIGGALFPVEVLMVFEDGTEVRESWDGKYRWKLFVQEKPAKLKYAAVDPERKLVLDLNYTNNSRLLEPASTFPALKWASKWMIWIQDLLATFAFFV